MRVLAMFLLVFLLWQSTCLAQSVNNWPNPRREYNSWMSDRAELLPWQVEYALNRRLTLLARRTSAELAIATTPQIEAGISTRQVALSLFNTWGVGHRDRNNGVLLLASLANRRIEIITGTGLSEILPDSEVSQLIQQEIVPAFQQQDYKTGIQQGAIAIAQRLEARLPSTVLPQWMPAAVLWLGWILAAAGMGLTILGTVQAIQFSRSRVQVAVPSQGLDTRTFANSSAALSSYALPQLLARLFTPSEHDWQQEIPTKFLSYVWVGGMILGLGVIQGFWQFVLMHPGATFWQRDAVAWGVYACGSALCLLPGILVTHRFLANSHLVRDLAIELLILGCTAVLGSYIWLYYIASGLEQVLIMGCWLAMAWLIWWVVVGNDLRFRRQRVYCCDRTGQPIQELSAQELTAVLSQDECLAQSMQKLEFRGWRAAELELPLTKAQVYLLRRSEYKAHACRQCHSFAVETSARTVEKTVESHQKINRKRVKVASVKEVKQTVYTCCSCGSVEAVDQPQIPSPPRENQYFRNHSSDSSTRSTSSGATTTYEPTYYPTDYASGGDFSGGSSDGGGAGSDW